MRPEPSNRLDPRAIRLWQVQGVTQSIVLSVMLLVGGFPAVLMLGVDMRLLALLIPFALLHALLLGILGPYVRWRIWRYDLDEHELDIQQGLLVVRRTLVPLVRVQHVDTVQGPLAKLFGLSSVTVSTAASTHEIPALPDALADGLRDKISHLARHAREQL